MYLAYVVHSEMCHPVMKVDKADLEAWVCWVVESECRNDRKAVCRQPHTRSVYCTPAAQEASSRGLLKV